MVKWNFASTEDMENHYMKPIDDEAEDLDREDGSENGSVDGNGDGYLDGVEDEYEGGDVGQEEAEQGDNDGNVSGMEWHGSEEQEESMRDGQDSELENGLQVLASACRGVKRMRGPKDAIDSSSDSEESDEEGQEEQKGRKKKARLISLSPLPSNQLQLRDRVNY